jgi:hypothetical protein
MIIGRRVICSRQRQVKQIHGRWSASTLNGVQTCLETERASDNRKAENRTVE